jgi:hypothetical protein
MIALGTILGRHRWRWGQTVYRSGGTWRVGHVFDHDTLAAADALPAGDTSESSYAGKYVWIGGHTFTVTEAIKTAILAAGVGGTFS